MTTMAMVPLTKDPPQKTAMTTKMASIDEDPIDGIDNDGDGSVDEDPPADANDDNKAGIADADDDGDGSIDEGQ